MRHRTVRHLVAAVSLLTLAAGAVGLAFPLRAEAATASSWLQLSPSTSPSTRYAQAGAYDPGSGNAIIFSGCSGGFSCTLTADTWSWNGTTWSQLSPATSPTARYSGMMAYDTGSSQMILFGGYTGSVTHTPLNDTWSWNGTTWTQLSPVTSPTARWGAALAYDPVSGDLILFGGYNGTTELNDTWSWNGTTWTQLSPTTSPTKRMWAGMALDPSNSKLVMFGGYNGTSNLSETWSWNGTDWSQLSPATHPGGVSVDGMAADPAGGTVILFSSGNTWSWDGSNWTQLSPGASPPQRTNTTLIDDAGSGKLTLFGGYVSGPTVGGTNDTWVFYPSVITTATTLNPSANPATVGQTVTYTATETPSQGSGTPTGKVTFYDSGTAINGCSGVALSGGSASCAAIYATTGSEAITASYSGDSTYGGNTSSTLTETVNAAPASSTNPKWTSVSTSGPATRDNASGAYDPATGQYLMFGGLGASALADTWSWNGTAWTQLSPATSPPARYAAAMAYDPASGRLILFGGYDGTSELSDTWSWNGTTWTQLSPATSPGGRDSATLVYDPTGSRLILFGGYDGGAALAETWSWNGTTWSQLSPSASPAARLGASAAYDSGSGQLILFGGEDSTLTPVDQDTWQWDGGTSNWVQLSPAASPEIRGYASMDYDPATGGLILFGGLGSDGLTDLQDTWAWNGSTWVQQGPTASPAARSGAATAWDPATDQFLIFSGDLSTTDTWNYDANATTTTSLSSSMPSLNPGGSTVFTATVAQSPVAGTVSFTDNGTVISGCSAVPLSSGKATCTYAYTAAGTRTILASYSGDPSYAASVSSGLAQVLAASTPAPTAAPSPTPAPGGGSVPVPGAGADIGGASLPLALLLFGIGALSLTFVRRQRANQ